MVNSLQQYVDTFEALGDPNAVYESVSYTHLRAHET